MHQAALRPWSGWEMASHAWDNHGRRAGSSSYWMERR
jgi:hypothetical protein